MAHIRQPGNLNRIDHKVAISQHIAPVGRNNHLPGLALQLDQSLGDFLGQLKPNWVKIDQRECATVKPFDVQNVGHHLAGKYRTARADHCHFGHGKHSTIGLLSNCPFGRRPFHAPTPILARFQRGGNAARHHHWVIHMAKRQPRDTWHLKPLGPCFQHF